MSLKSLERVYTAEAEAVEAPNGLAALEADLAALEAESADAEAHVQEVLEGVR